MCPGAGASSKFAYMSGQTYEYRYDGDIKTSIPGSTEHSSLHIRASALVEVISQCEMVLRLTDVSLQDSDPSRYETRQHVDKARMFKQSLESKPLRFAFIDGTIENVCPTAGEEVWTLNVKRGVLSTLQNTMTSLQGMSSTTETDVSGTCPVKYEVTSSYGTQKLRKSKNLLACTDSASARTVFQGVPYASTSDFQTMPLLRSTHQCDQEVNGRSKVMTRSECTETHVFLPFSQSGSGATTELTYKLVFQLQTEGTQRLPAGSISRKALLYDHSLSATELAVTLHEAQNTLTKLCRQTETDVRPEAPGLFASLTKQLRQLDIRSLRQLMNQAKTVCTKAEMYVRDALPVLGTTAAVTLIRELVTSGQVSKLEQEVMLASIAFIKEPTADMMKELQTLLAADMERAALPVSSVINTFCKNNRADNPVITAIIKTFETELRYNCKPDTDAATARTMLALRALGNAGNSDSVAATLNRCALNEEAPMAVRVAAINAFRRMSCSTSRDEMMRLFETRAADAELRINAYLAVMQCVDRAIVDRVRRQLETEEVNQVGSFVWTHLTNLAETSCPLKADIAAIIEDPHLLNEFDIDKRKFSRNIELSTFNHLMNMGAAVDTNLIWSAGSYVPRSAAVNLTVDLFGQSVNLLEVGGRAQGMESVLEKYFAPGGEMSEAMKRDKRAVIKDEVMTNIDRRYPKTRDPTQVSYFLRIFGNEIRSGDIFSLDAIKARFSTYDPLAMLAQDRSIDFTRNFAFLDTNLVVPTGVGMPLRLGVEGTVTVALTANGKIDLRSMLRTPSNFDVTGSVRPSAAVELQGEFGVDAYVTRTRLRVTNTLHTSTLVSGKVTLRDGQVFNAEWNMPQQKMEIFSAESHFYISYRDEEREQTPARPNAVQLKRCTAPAWSSKLGLELCGELAHPGLGVEGAMLPFSGPAVAKLYLNKLDTFTSAKLEASVISSASAKTDIARFSFTMPGSRTDRELTADFKLDRANKDLTFNLKSPWKKVAVTGQLVDQRALKRVTLKAIVDDRLEYSASADVAITEVSATETKYVPSVRVIIPGRETVTLDGELTYSRNKKVMFNMAIRNALREPITAEGSIAKTDKSKTIKYELNAQFASPVLRGSVAAFATNITDVNQAWTSRADVNYQYMNGAKQRVVVNHKWRDTSNANLKSYSTDASWITTFWPQYNGNVQLEEQYSPTSVRTRIEAGFDNMRKVIIVQSGAFDVSGIDKKLNGMIKFEVPYKDWNYEAKLDHVHNSDMLQTNGSVKYDGNKEHTLDVGVRKDNTKYLQAVGEARLKMAGQAPITLTNALTERVPREYHNELNVIAPSRTVRAVTVYKMGQRHELTTDVQASGLDPITIKGHFNPNPKSFQAHAEVAVGRAEYMADLSWLHRATAVGFNTRAAAEVGVLSQRYGLSWEASLRNQDFSLTSELKAGENRKATLSGQVTANPTTPKVDLRLGWQNNDAGNFVAFTGAAQYETRSWAQTNNDFEASAKVTTSFPGYEEASISTKFDINADSSVRSNGQVTWGVGKKISADLSYNKTKAVLAITTPFNGYTTIRGESTYLLRGRSLTSSAKVQWESKTISLSLEGSAPMPAFNGRLAFTSPFKDYESMSASVRNQVTGDRYQTTGDVSWARGQQISFSGTMMHQRGSGYALSNQGEATLTTPWRGYRSSKLTWRHANDDGTTWTCHHELEMDGGKKYVVDIDGRKTLTRAQCKYTIGASFTSPIQGWERLALVWDHTHATNAIKSQGKASVTWAQNSIELNHDVDITPYMTFVTKVAITTPFRGLEVMGIDLDNKLNTRSNAYTLTNEVTLGSPNKKYNLDGSLMFNGATFNTGIRITTPSQKVPRIVGNLRNARQPDGAWALHGDLEYAANKAMSLDAKINYERNYSAELTFVSPCPYLRSLVAKAGVNARSARSFEATAELSHNMLRDKLRFESSLDAENIKNARLSVSLTTPFEQLSVARLSASHVYKQTSNPSKCTTMASYELNERRGQLSHDQIVRSMTDFEGKTVIEYTQGRRITIDHSAMFSNGRSVVTATLTSPFNEARNVQLNANFEGPANNFRGTAEITYNQRERITANIDHVFSPEMGVVKSSVRIATPYAGFSRFIASIDRSGSSLDSSYKSNVQRYTENSEVVIEYNDQRYVERREIDITEGGVYKYKYVIETPLEWLRNAQASYEYTPRSGRAGNGWTITGSGEYNGKRYTSEAEYLWIGKQLRAKLITNVPDEYSIIVNHKADRSEITSSAAVKAGTTGSGSVTFTMNPAGTIDARATVETTIRGLEKFEANLKHEGPVSDFKTTLSVATPFRDYRNFAAALSYRGNPTDFTSSLRLDTPSTKYPRVTFALNHRMPNTNSLDTGLSATYGDKKYAASVVYNKDDRSIRTSITTETPHAGYERQSLEVTHTGASWRFFDTTAKLVTSQHNDLREATVALSFKLPDNNAGDIQLRVGLPTGTSTAAYKHNVAQGGNAIQASLEVTTPYSGYERWGSSFTRTVLNGKPSNKITVTTPIRGYESFELTTEKTGNMDNLSLKATLVTSIRGWERASASWTHSMADEQGEVKVLVETSIRGWEKTSFAGTESISKRGDMRFTGTFETTYPGYQRFAYTLEHTRTNRGIKTTASVETPIRGYEKFGGNFEYNQAERNGFRVGSQITTPIQGYRNFGFTINHAGDASQFETSGSITTPFSQAPRIDYTLRYRVASLADFSVSASAAYSGKKIEVETMYKYGMLARGESNYEASFKFASACPYLRDLSVTASHNRKPSLKSGALAVTYNSEKKIDFDYSYTTDGSRNLKVNIRDPYPMATNLNVGDETGSAVVNWDSRDSSKMVRFDFGLKHIETAALTERLITFKTMVPGRTVGFLFGYTLEADKFSHRGELLWDADPQPDFAYEIQGSKTVRRSQQAYDGKFKVTSELVNLDTTFSHKSQPGRKHVTELTLQTSEKLTFKNELTFTGEQDMTHSITITHPRFTRDVSLVTEVKNGNSFTTTVNYEDQRATLEGSLATETRDQDSTKYTGSLRLAHPRSLTDVKLNGEAYYGREKVGGNLAAQYQSAKDRQMKTATLRAEINRIRRELSTELVTPLSTLKLAVTNRETSMTKEGVLHYDVTASVGRANYHSSIDLSTPDRSFGLKLVNSEDNSVELFAQAYTPTQSSFELSRIVRGEKITDMRASLSRSQESIVTGYAFLRPELSRDIRAAYLSLSQGDCAASREFKTAWQQFTRAADDDFRLRARSIDDLTAPFKNAAKAVSNDVNGKVEQIQSAFNDAYRRNEFYMRDIHQTVQRHYEDLSRRMQYKMSELRRTFRDVIEWSERVNRAIVQYISDCAAAMERRTRDMRADMSQHLDKVKRCLDNTGLAIKLKIMDAADYIRTRPWFQTAMEQYALMQPSDFLLPPSQWLERMRANYVRIIAHLQAMLDSAMQRSDITQIREFIIKSIQENQWMYQYLGLEQKVQEYVQAVRSMSWPQLRAKIQQAASEHLKLDKNRWTIWNPQRGEYGFEVYMPIDLPDLALLQRLEVPKRVAMVRKMLARYMPDEDWTLLDTIYRYKPSSDVRDWVPPFKGHASLTGAQSYMTFDKKFFEFAGECSYLLARDFIDKTFSVVVNYDKLVRGLPTKKSITVLSEGKNIEVFPDAKITLDGTRVEMPLKVGNTTVSRQGSTISVKNDLGLDITCDLPHDHCTVAVSGWYYGKTAGLLGTYDNEPSNDFTTIDRSQAERPEQLADGWTVGTKCRPINRAIATTTVDPNTRRYRACAAHFLDMTSPFRACYRSVDPAPFLRMCLAAVPAGDNSLEAQENVCDTDAAYVRECRSREVHLRLPSQCVTCKVPLTHEVFLEGQTKLLTDNKVPKIADVVFVVQHAPCNRDVLDKVKGMVDDLEKALTATGLRSVQYALVGYGGQDYLTAPQIRTMDGQIFNTASKVAAALGRFDFMAGDNPDTMLALRYAARLPFRAGASKSIILLACDSCTEQSVRYSDLQRVLVQTDIRLHVISQQSITLRSNTPKGNYIFGADEQTVYTSKDVAGDDLAGEPDLRTHVRLPKDLCVALTHNAAGSVWSARQWIDARPVIQKKFSDVMVRAMARAAQPTECQTCDCVADETGTGVSRCRNCNLRHIYLMRPDFNLLEPAPFDEVKVAPTPKPSGVTTIRVRPTRVQPTRKPRPPPGPKKIPPTRKPVPAPVNPPVVRDQ